MAEEFWDVRSRAEELHVVLGRPARDAVRQRSVPDHEGTKRLPFGAQAGHDVDETIGLLLGCHGTDEDDGDRCGGAGSWRPGMKQRVVPSVRYHDCQPAVHPEALGALLQHLVTYRHNQVRTGH